MQKQAKQKELMERASREKELDVAERQQRHEAMERKRKYQIKKSREHEEHAKREAAAKIEQEERRLRQLAEQRRKEQLLLKAEKDLQLQTKKENLDRLKRAQDYHLKQQLKKAESDDKRCRELKERKDELRKVRQKNAALARRKKDRLMALVEASKSGGSSGIKKLLKSVATGDLLEEEAREVAPRRTSPRAREAEDLGPPPEAPALKMQFWDEEEEEGYVPADSYKSPYETDFYDDS